MGSRDMFSKKRALSVAFEDFGYLSASKTREIDKAIHNRNPSALLNQRISRTSVSPSFRNEDKGGSSFQLQILKKTINQHRLRVDSGDKNLTNLKSALRQLDIQSAKNDFQNKQLVSQAKSLEYKIEQTLKRQQEEIQNQDIYQHLLKRMKKTKIFLDLQAFKFNEQLKFSSMFLSSAQQKSLSSIESRSKVLSFMRLMGKEIKKETQLGSINLYHLNTDIEKIRIQSERQEEWKQHQESMFEAAVIEDRSKKNLGIKESINLHRIWYNNLTSLFERKKLKFQKLEEAFQKIKIFTGLNEIQAVVENFLTKECTYAGLLQTVQVKEFECNDIKERINKLQGKVDEISNLEVEKGVVEKCKADERNILKANLELAQKKYLIESVREKVKTWINEMTRKLAKITGVEVDSNRVASYKKRNKRTAREGDRLVEMVYRIREICRAAIYQHKFAKSLGMVIEKNRKIVVSSMINQYSKEARRIVDEEIMDEAELIGY